MCPIYTLAIKMRPNASGLEKQRFVTQATAAMNTATYASGPHAEKSQSINLWTIYSPFPVIRVYQSLSEYIDSKLYRVLSPMQVFSGLFSWSEDSVLTSVKQEKNEKNKKEKKEKEKKEKGRSKHGKGKSEKPEEGEPQAPKRARKSKWILLSYVGTDCLRAIAFCVGTPNGISWGNLQATCHEIGTG